MPIAKAPSETPPLEVATLNRVHWLFEGLEIIGIPPRRGESNDVDPS